MKAKNKITAACAIAALLLSATNMPAATITVKVDTVAPTAVGTLPPTGSGSSAPLYDLALAVLALGSLAIVITARRRAGRT